MVKREEVYEPLNEQLDIIMDSYDVKTKAQLITIMRQKGFRKKKTKEGCNYINPSELQLDYSWRYLKDKSISYEKPKEEEKYEYIMFKKLNKRRKLLRLNKRRKLLRLNKRRKLLRDSKEGLKNGFKK